MKKIPILSAILAVLLLFSLNAEAADDNQISVTAVEVINSSATITINDCVVITDISVEKDEQNIGYLKFPEYLDKDEKRVIKTLVLFILS